LSIVWFTFIVVTTARPIGANSATALDRLERY